METVVSLQPGAVRVLWRLSKGEPEGGEEFRWQNELVRLRDGRRGELTTLISPTFQPLWEVVYPRLSPGERLWARAERVQRNGELEWELMLEVEGAE